MQSDIPLSHRIAYKYSQKGFRGSSYVWKLVRSISSVESGVVVSLPNGFPLIIDETDWIARTIYEGTYERPLLGLLNRISVTECFVDVGANIGVTLWNGMKKSHAGATYCAIEPSEQCQSGLFLSTKKIDRSGQVLKIALGDKSERRLMYGLNNPGQSGGASLLGRPGLLGDDMNVQVSTLDNLIEKNELTDEIFLLKIDTEGYEEQVLTGAKQLISTHEVKIYILEVSPSFCSTKWVQDLYDKISFNYSFFQLVEKGLLQMKPKLIQLTIDEAMRINEQWNLIIIRNDYIALDFELQKIIVTGRVIS